MNDIGTAFSAPFKDPDWLMKFLIGSLMILLCLTGLGLFVLLGYYIELTQRVMRKEQYPLPEWRDLGVKFIVGFKYVVVLLLYAMPIILLLIPLLGFLLLAATGSEGNTPAIIASIYLFGYVILAIPYSILLMLLTPIISYRYAARESIADALDVSTILRLFKMNWESTTVVALLAVGVESIAGIGVIAFIIGVLVSLFYVYLVAAFLHGMLYLNHQSAMEVNAA
jgi:hypothetical protein